MSKVSDNKSAKEIELQMKGFETLGKVVKFFGFFGFRNKQLDEAFSQLPKMQQEFQKLTTLPDRFNAIFSERGWIAYESMKVDLMEEAIRFANEGKAEEGERKLIEYYTSNEVKWLSGTLRSSIFLRYRKYIEYARDDTLTGRHYSAVLVLLTIIDGVTSDINNGKGFFSEGIEVVVPDTIAGHETGLNKLSQLFGQSRKGKTDDDIAIPYRHGILHGRDLGYDNPIVTAKCWAFLFAVRDWIYGKEKAKTHISKQEKTWKEIINDMNELNKYKRVLNEWETRTFTESYLNNLNIKTLQNVDNNTPEYRVLEYLSYWDKKNYGGITELIWNKCFYDSLGKEKKRTREVFEGKNLRSFRFIKIEDTAPAISTITVSINFEWKNEIYTFDAIFRMIYENKDGDALTRGYEGGKWHIITRNFPQIEFPNIIK